MTALKIFLVGLVIAMGIVFLAFLYLAGRLRCSLADHQVPTSQKKFWLAFFNVVVVLVPFALVVGGYPAPSDFRGAAFQICSQIESALIGFSIAVVAAGFILAKFALQNHAHHSATGDATTAGSRPSKL